MNLQAKHFPLLLLGAVVGLGVGWLISLITTPGANVALEQRLPAMGYGAIGGAGVIVLLIVVMAARDPGAAPARNFTRINGTGSALFGIADRRPDGSYATTEWFTVLFVPVFPVCRYRVVEQAGGNFVHRTYTILEKMPPRWADVGKVYGIVALIAIAVFGFALFVSR